MNIQGEKVVLRAIELYDSDLLLDLINDSDTEKMLGGNSFPVSKESQNKWIEAQENRNNVLRCIIALKNDTEKGLGTIILSDIDYKNGVAQVHIKMAKGEGRGKGYGTDALQTVVRYAFNELRLNCIYADVLSYNIPSQRLFEKCRFRKDGLLRSRIFKNGEYVDVISYSILKEEL